MDTKFKQLDTIITKKVLKRKNKYQDICEILLGDYDKDIDSIFKPMHKLENENNDSILMTIDELENEDQYESVSSSNTDKKIDYILNEIYKVDPDLENDNSILWNILWFLGYKKFFVGEFINYLKRKGVTNRELARAFGNEEDTPFQIVREFIGPQILKEFTNEIRKSRMENIDTIKYRSRIIRLFLHKWDNDMRYIWGHQDFSCLLTNKSWFNQIRNAFEPKVYIINQWDCKIVDVIDTLSDIFSQVRCHNSISLKSMEFPFSPFYSVCVEALHNFETPKNLQTTLETLKNRSIKEATTRMEIVQEGIMSIRKKEHPLVMLWNIGQKHEQLKEPLNKMYNYPLFSKDIETKKWGQDVEKKIYKTIRNRNEFKAVKEVNFWTLPLENIVGIVMQLSIQARSDGSHSFFTEFFPQKAFQAASNIQIDKNPFQTKIQSTYKFLHLSLEMTVNDGHIDDIVYAMNFNASLIIQNLSSHLALVIYWVCKFNQSFNLYPSLPKRMVPKYILGQSFQRI